MKKGIRRRLMYSFFFTSGIICAVVVFVIITISASINSISSSYNSNKRLDEFKNLMALTESALESYMNLKTYETIDNYYSCRERLDQKTSGFYKQPSFNDVLQGEYTVACFTSSFLDYADMAVYERRAGNSMVYNTYYKEALTAYSFLSDSVIRLNEIYFAENIKRYNTMQLLVKQLTIYSFILVLIVVVFNILLVYYFVSTITQPLTEISQSANRLAERDFDIPLFTYKSNDEIGNICRAFNRMILSIREYIDTIWENAIAENELREKELKMNELYQEAKLTALQSQINPHFLFNTINTGAQLAMMEGDDRTCSFLEQVADFYRYNLQFTGQEAILEDEIKMVESYIYIMKVRFGNKFDFYTDIRYSNLNIKIPGMIIQPLIENCIKHGLANVVNGGRITLSIYQEKYNEKDTVIISVSDNGCGFPEDKRNQLLYNDFTQNNETVIKSNDSSSGTGVGLMNVISRLRMYYKYNDVFDISKSNDNGTVFLIRIKNV